MKKILAIAALLCFAASAVIFIGQATGDFNARETCRNISSGSEGARSSCTVSDVYANYGPALLVTSGLLAIAAVGIRPQRTSTSPQPTYAGVPSAGPAGPGGYGGPRPGDQSAPPPHRG